MTKQLLKKGAKVRCIDDANSGGSLVAGRIYTITRDEYSYVSNPEQSGVDIDTPDGYAWRRNRFVVVCPCGVTKCIAQHKDQ
jgi:hypothetical protein